MRRGVHNLHFPGTNLALMRLEVGLEANIPEGRPTCAVAGKQPLALFKIAGKVYAVDNRCTHVGGPLCRGLLKDAVITCPLHGSRFDVRSGQLVGGPAMRPIPSFPTIVDDGKVFVDVP